MCMEESETNFEGIAHFNIAQARDGLTETDKGNIIFSSDAVEIGITKRRRGVLHFHNATEVVVVLAGELEVRLVDGRKRHYQEGDVVIVPSPLLHATSSRLGAMMMTIRQKVPRE